MGWAAMRDRMHARVVAHLKDGCAEYRPPGGAPPVRGIEVIFEKNLVMNGPNGELFESESSGFTWRKKQLRQVDRGGYFVFAGRRFDVEDTVRDDGHMVTAACMEEK